MVFDTKHLLSFLAIEDIQLLANLVVSTGLANGNILNFRETLVENVGVVLTSERTSANDESLTTCFGNSESTDMAQGN